MSCVIPIEICANDLKSGLYAIHSMTSREDQNSPLRCQGVRAPPFIKAETEENVVMLSDWSTHSQSLFMIGSTGVL